MIRAPDFALKSALTEQISNDKKPRTPEYAAFCFGKSSEAATDNLRG